jgi:DNA-binding MarR family transcriptional regulator
MKDMDAIRDLHESAGRPGQSRFMLIMLFLIEQRWRYIIDRELAPDNLTTKQFLMLIVIVNAFDSPPSIQEVAGQLSTTHQNVKQIAASLESRGFMKIERDEKNRRILRLKVTDRCIEFWEKRGQKDAQSVASLFEGLTDEEVATLFHIMDKLERRADELYLEARK